VSTEKIPRNSHRHRLCGKLKEHKLMKLCLAGQIESNYDETVDSFDTMNLKPELLRGTIRCAYVGKIMVNKMMQVSTPMVSSVPLLSSSVLLCQSLRVSFEEHLSFSAISNKRTRPRCHCASPIRNRKDRNFLYLSLAKA